MAKILISGQANTGKTSLLQTLEDVLIISNDGKKYPFKQPHIYVDVTTSDSFITAVSDGMEMYKEKVGEYPTTIAIDSISKVLQDIENHYLMTVSSYPYGPIGKDIAAMMAFLENDLAKQGFNIVFVSHAIKDGDGQYALVTAGGSSGKRGGVIAEVDNAIYVNVQGKKRTVHHKDPKLLSRSLLADVPEKQNVEDFNLQEYLTLLTSTENDVDEWCLG